MIKKLLIGALLAFGILIVVTMWASSWFASRLETPDPAGPSPYTAVYLTTGDIYFGKFSAFPKPHMTDVWFVQRSVGQNDEPKFGIVSFNNAFWGPVNEINFSPSQILFWARLRNDSQVVRGINDPSLFQQNIGTPATTTPSLK